MVANQKRVIINKEKCDMLNHYAVVNINALQQAMCNLKKAGTFKLWMYLAKNQNGYSFDLSCVDCGKWGIKPDTYHAAVKELIEKKYLIEIKNKNYDFYEIPFKEDLSAML